MRRFYKLSSWAFLTTWAELKVIKLHLNEEYRRPLPPLSFPRESLQEEYEPVTSAEIWLYTRPKQATLYNLYLVF